MSILKKVVGTSLVLVTGGFTGMHPQPAYKNKTVVPAILGSVGAYAYLVGFATRLKIVIYLASLLSGYAFVRGFLWYIYETEEETRWQEST